MAIGIMMAGAWEIWGSIIWNRFNTFLGKDNTSSISVEVNAPQQHPDAVRTWRRITYTYEDGCQIVLDGEGKEENVPYIEGPKGKLYPGFHSDIPKLERKLAAFPDPESQVSDFSLAVKERKKFALNEENGQSPVFLLIWSYCLAVGKIFKI